MPQKSNVKRSFVTRAFFFSIRYKWFLIFLAKLNVFPQQVMIVMTHMTNYGNDQLALYTISRLVDFVYRWTNLELKYASPLELADIYFKLFPQDKSPVWLVSCRWTMILLWSSMDGSTTAMSGGLGGGEGRDATVLLIPVVGILTPPDIPVNGVELSFPILFFLILFWWEGTAAIRSPIEIRQISLNIQVSIDTIERREPLRGKNPAQEHTSMIRRCLEPGPLGQPGNRKQKRTQWPLGIKRLMYPTSTTFCWGVLSQSWQVFINLVRICYCRAHVTTAAIFKSGQRTSLATGSPRS